MKAFEKLPILWFGLALFFFIIAFSSTVVNGQNIPLGESLDNTSLTWTTGGDADWFGQSEVSYYDGDAAQSGTLTEVGQSSWIETTVTGPAVLSFYWRHYCIFDNLKFYIDGVERFENRPYPYWVGPLVCLIKPGSHTLKWVYSRDSEFCDESDVGYLDKVLLGPIIPLDEALDNTSLTWTTGGDTDWFGQTSVYYYDGDAAQSGTLTEVGQSSWIETTVTGPAVLSFAWKIEAPNNDDLIFYIDGVEYSRISGDVDGHQKLLQIPPGYHTLRWTYIKGWCVAGSKSEAGWLDKVQLGPCIPLGEALDNTSLEWRTGGDADWIGQTWVTYFDGDAAQSGEVGNGQVSWIETTVTGPGILSFYWKVSSHWTDLKFYVDGVEHSWCRADSAWELKAFSIESGSHELRWAYEPFGQEGEAGFLDKVVFTSGPEILLMSPNGMETWYKRNFYTIRWVSSEDVGQTVKIELYEGESLSRTISASTDNDGYYRWFVPVSLTPGADYQIKITSTSNSSVYDFSDNYFSIAEWCPFFGGCLVLKGDDYAEAQDHPELDVGDKAGESFTIEAWINIDFLDYSQAEYRYIVDKPNSYRLYAKRYSGWDPSSGSFKTYGSLGFKLWLPSGEYKHREMIRWPSYQTGWHHVALVFNKETGEASLYMDGEAFSDPDYVGPAINNSSENLRVGENFKGAVDEVRISDYVRYTGSTYNATSPFTCDQHTRALWHFDEPEDALCFHDACGADNILSKNCTGDFASYGDIDGLAHSWQAVNLSATCTDPIVIVGPPTYHGTDPGVIRLQNVTNNSFEIRFQEWLYKDGTHTQENIPYLVISDGRHQMANGSIWEAGTFYLSGTGAWTAHAFTDQFPSTPALFLTIQTYNGPDPITVRARNVTNTGFEAALFEEENKMDGHTTEEVGYLAVYSPQLSGTVNINGTDVPYLLQAQSVDHRFVPVLSSDIKLEEEQSKDTEINHINETVSILALGDKIFTQDISSNGGDTIAIRRLAPEYGAAMEWGTVDGVDQNWMKIPLAKEYLNPVVVAKPVSSLGGDPGVIRIRNASHNSFELRYNEWAYKDGWHTQERVFYMVVEAGERSVAGLTVEAGKLNTSKLLADGWEPITFSASFSQTPSVFTSVQTYNGADPVTTRLRDCTAAGFDLTMDEEEAKNDGHTTENIGWIAIEKGTGNTNDNRSVVVLSGSTNHIPTQINFGQVMARRFPVVVSDMITTYGGDPCFLRYQNLGPSSIDLFIQEEASLDAEINHVVEDVSVFVGE